MTHQGHRAGTSARAHDALRRLVQEISARFQALGVIPRQPIGQDPRVDGIKVFDAGQWVKGRKQQVLVDTLGMLIAVVLASNLRDT